MTSCTPIKLLAVPSSADTLALALVTASYLDYGFHADPSRLLQPKWTDDGTAGVVKFGRLPRFPDQFCTLIYIHGEFLGGVEVGG